jgi:hypothetical protein
MNASFELVGERHIESVTTDQLDTTSLDEVSHFIVGAGPGSNRIPFGASDEGARGCEGENRTAIVFALRSGKSRLQTECGDTVVPAVSENEWLFQCVSPTSLSQSQQYIIHLKEVKVNKMTPYFFGACFCFM